MRTTTLMKCHNTWAVVLAAGDGTRLAALTTDAQGNRVPKQYCSVNGGSSLLQIALRRAQRVAPRSQICMVVAEYHEPYWCLVRGRLPPENVFVEPRNRGTAIGVLSAVLRIAERDDQARIIFLPADHFVRKERPLASAMRTAVNSISGAREELRKELLLIGVRPTEPDPEFGYIVPSERAAGARRVADFVEKPNATEARDLIARGAVWNSFIFAAHVQTLLHMLRAQIPEIVEKVSQARRTDQLQHNGSSAIADLYQHLPSVDFSRTIIRGVGPALRVVIARSCGWLDLGSPRRVAKVAAKARSIIGEMRRPARSQTLSIVDIVEQFGRLARPT